MRGAKFPLLLLLGLVVLVLVYPHGEDKVFALPPLGIESIEPTSTTFILPAATPIPLSPTPLPTSTPEPSPTPSPTPVNMIGAFGKGQEVDQFWSVWGGRIVNLAFLFVVLVVLPISAFRIYDQRMILKAEIEIARIQASVPVIEPTPVIVRPTTEIPINRPVLNNNDALVSVNGTRVYKSKLQDFISRSLTDNQMGLSIGQWKGNGWSQPDLEKLLDFMASIGLVTPRQNGRACAYTRVFTPDEVLNAIYLNA